MYNAAISSPAERGGRRYIPTHMGVSGHAIYGPYELLEPSHYVVEFSLSAAEPQWLDSDKICARVDVAAEFGSVILALQHVALRQLRDGAISIRLRFHNEVAQHLEFRVGVTGCIPLLIEEYRPVVRLERADFGLCGTGR